MPDEQTIFDEEHLAKIRAAFNDKVAYELLVEALPRVTEIIGYAREKGCNAFKCEMLLGPIYFRLHFRGMDGSSRFSRSIYLAKAYEKRTGKYFGIDIAVEVKAILESLILSVPGIEAMRRLR